MGNGCMSIKKTEKVHILENDREENKVENTKIENAKIENIKIENTINNNIKINNVSKLKDNRELNPKEENTGKMYSQYNKNGKKILIPYHFSAFDKKEILDLH